MTENQRPGRRRGIASVALLSLGGLLPAGAILWAFLGTPPAYQGLPLNSDHMMPTYRHGDRVPVAMNPVRKVERGEVVLVPTPWGNGQDSLFRVVAVGGDHISFAPGTSRLMLNDRPLEEPYLMDRAVAGTVPFDVVVPEGRIFLMGDNRGNSNDSSYHATGGTDGTVAVSAVHAEIVADPAGYADIRWVLPVLALPFLAGAGLGISALAVRKRAPKWVPQAPVSGPATAT